MFSRYVSGMLLRRYNLTCEPVKQIHFSFQSCGRAGHGKFKWCGRKMSMWLREQSIQVVKACTRQFEFIAAQRIRRSLQLFHLYSRIWDEVALREFIRTWRRRMVKNTKDFMIGAVGVATYNWDHERISDKEVHSYSKEIEGIYKLQDLTVVCPDCKLRLVIDVHQSGIQYCQCTKRKRAYIIAQQNGIEWEPFIERQDMLVWRREEKESRGLYSYKVYGSFNDVSAEDFLQVQIDIDYRKKWDATAKQLEVVDSDPLYKDSERSHSDVIYWEMVWPRMFANRDYVYKRRWHYDEKTGIITIISRGTEHPNAPERSDTQRVSAYWSYMVIKPNTNFHEPGIEFGLTYFDDPGANLPAAVTAWVALSGLPDYLIRMRQAGKDYKNYKAMQEPTIVPKSTTIVNSQAEENVNTNSNSDQDSKTGEPDTKTISNNIASEPNDLGNTQPCTSLVEVDQLIEDNEKEEDNESNSSQDEDQGLLDYFFSAKIFA